jgi:hypothetical protein
MPYLLFAEGVLYERENDMYQIRSLTEKKNKKKGTNQ